MKLNDLFWIKKLELKKGNYRYDDTLSIMEFVKEETGIELSFLEALTLWEIFSDNCCAGWLCLNEETKKRFLYANAKEFNLELEDYYDEDSYF